MSFNKRKLLFLIVLLMAGGAVVLLHLHVKHIERSPVMDRAPWALKTAVVSEGSVNQGFPALGKVVSSTEVRIVPQISGTILTMGPRAGGMVHKGELIVLLDTRTLEADAGALKAKLASAVAVENNDRKEMQREQRLMQEGGSSASSVEQYQTRVRSDQANVHALKKQLESLRVKISYGHILAPINGRIAKRLAEPGDAVFPGKIIYTLTADKGGRVVVPVPLDTLTRIKPGGKVELSLGGQSMMARITRVNPSLDALAMGSLEIDLPQRPFHLPDSAPISVHVLTSAATGLTVPVDSLRPAAKYAQQTLFKIIDQPKPHLQQVSVNIQLCGKKRCVITGHSGANNLHAGDHVVTAHGSVLLQLHDGDPVSVNQKVAVRP